MVQKFLRIAAIIYIAYVAIALLIITPALNYFPHKYVQDTYGRQLHTNWVLLNPFIISLGVSKAELTATNGKPFASFGEASINLSMESLWHNGWIFDSLKMHNIFIDVVRETDDEFNFSDLLSSDSEEQSPEPDTEGIPGVTVHDLDIHANTILMTDNARETPYHSEWSGLNVHVTGLSTVLDEGQPYIVNIVGEGGGKLHWEGTVSIHNQSSQGLLSLSNVSLLTLWRFAEPWLEFELKDGRLAVGGKYAINWGDTFSYRISEGHIGLSMLDIVPANPDQLADTLLGLGKLDITAVEIDSKTARVAIDSLAIDDLQVATWLEGSQVSLQQLFALDLSTDDSTTTDEDAAKEDDDSAAWNVVLNQAQMTNSGLRWRSKITEPSQLEIKPIEASVKNITWPLSEETELSLKLAVNEQVNIDINGKLALAEGNGTLSYTLDGLPLAWFNPNLPGALRAKISGGQARADGQLTLQKFEPTLIALNAIIRDFSARQEDAETMLTGFSAVRFDGLSVDMEQHNLVLEKLSIESYTGRLHIKEDGSINASNIWKEEVGHEAEELAESLTEEKPWSISVPVIQISDSEIDFMDQSLPIQFRTVIGELEGEILNISSDSARAAKVEIKGSVDGYAPVALTGNAAPLASPADLDLNLSFDGVDMARLSPYTGTYAGYAIDRGLLNLKLHYALKGDRLQGDNSIRIEKLKLGEKVSSDKSVNLPLELALAILTDSNGVIDVQVPVSGDVDNPEFALGGVIFKAFINILTKAITAPFTLLAGLVDSQEDLQTITFASGSTQLDATGREKLTQLSTALEQRPQLSLILTGRLNLAADRERMQKNAVKVQLLAAGLSAEEITAKGLDWEEAISSRFKALATGNTDEAAPTAREQYLLVVESIDIPDIQLRELAQERAATVKRYLLNEAALAPERAVVGKANLEDEDNSFSGVEMGIES